MKPDAPPLHEDPELFREAVRYTAAETGFAARLIEKDYFCSLVLAHLAQAAAELVFKGGTCLAKVHVGFHRMSEDLDFVLPTSVDSTRSERSRRSAPAKAAISALPRRDRAFRIAQPLTGANESLQYVATIAYDSGLARQEESIRIEIGLREPLLTPSVSGQARTLLLDPVSGRTRLDPISIAVLSLDEALAEKFRAALSRRDVAIRDFFDLDHAERAGSLRATELVPLVRRKLAVPGSQPVDVSSPRRAALERRLETDLKPVLRPEDFRAFDLERAWRLVVEMAVWLERSRPRDPES
jgi:predicted nucleotidyltransferase component of viral defense system